MGRLSQDVGYALRQLLRNPGFTAVAVLTLALGIGANSAVFSILDAVLIRPLPYPNAEQLVKVNTYNLKSGDLYGKTSYPDFVDWSEQNRFFRKIASYEEKTFSLAGIPRPERIRGEVVSSDFFETLGVEPYKGRSFAADLNQQAVVLSYPLWSNSFASDPGVIGRSITLDGYAYEVIGIMSPSYQFPDPQTEIWVAITSVRPDLREEIATRGNLGMSVVGRLAADVTLSQAQAGMTAVASSLARVYPASNRDLGVRLVPLREDMVGNFRPALLILMGSAALVLLIACANIGTLLLSRAAARQPEFAIRSSLGATRGRIIWQLLTESLLLALIGGTLGVLGAFFLMHVLIAWAPIDIPRISSAHIDLAVLVFTCLVSSLAGILFGLAPAWQISRNDPKASLKQNARNARRAQISNEDLGRYRICPVARVAGGCWPAGKELASPVQSRPRLPHRSSVDGRSTTVPCPIKTKGVGLGFISSCLLVLKRCPEWNPQVRRSRCPSKDSLGTSASRSTVMHMGVSSISQKQRHALSRTISLTC